jgi:hypothetical protein
MSNLRIAGIIVGMLGLLVTFLMYRGPKWKKGNFILFSLFNLSLVVACVNPNLVNFLRDLLSLQEYQYSRLFTLLIISIIFLLFYAFNTKTRLENLRIQMDKLIRNLGTTDFESKNEVKDRMKPIMIVIPAYDEAENLKELLPKIPKDINAQEVGVLVVDDGSRDATANVVYNHGYLCVSNRINRGQGAASRLGYDILLKYNVEIGVTMDADNQHMPEDIEKLIRPILENKYDLVIGSRILGGHEKVNWLRNVGITVLSWIVNLVTGLRVTDCSSGFKAFNVRKLIDLDLTEDQFQSSEVLIEASKNGLQIGEVPIRVRLRKHGQSKKGTDWNYGLSFAKTIIKTWWR